MVSMINPTLPVIGQSPWNLNDVLATIISQGNANAAGVNGAEPAGLSNATATFLANTYSALPAGTASEKRTVRYSETAGKLRYKDQPFIDAGDYFADYNVGAGQDVTAALQAAVNAAIAKNVDLVIPSPGAASYRLSSTILIQPNTAFGSATNLSIKAQGAYFTFLWAGANGTASAMQPVFKSLGWKRAVVEGINVRIPNGAQYVIAFDNDTDATYNSSGVLNWQSCFVTGAGNNIGCIGWRFGHNNAGEMSNSNWTNCSVEWDPGASLCQGWVNENTNGLNWSWYSCAVVRCYRGWSNASTAGATGIANGGASMYFYGCGSSYCDTVFYFICGGQYGVWGGRHEVGGKMLTVANSSNDLLIAVTLEGMLISNMAGNSDGEMFSMNVPGTLSLRDLWVQAMPGAKYGARFITVSSGSARSGTLNVDNCSFGASDPCYTVQFGSWRVAMNNVKKGTVSGVGDSPDAQMRENGYFAATGASPAAVATMSRVEQASGTSVTPILPDGTQAGDLLVISLANGASSITTPTGWTDIATARPNGGGALLYMAYKIATGFDTMPTIAVTSGPTTTIVYRIRNVSTTAPIGSNIFTIGTASQTTAQLYLTALQVPNALLLESMAIDSQSLTLVTPTGLTTGPTDTGTGYKLTTSYQTAVSAAAQGHTWSNSSGTSARYFGIMVGIRAAS